MSSVAGEGVELIRRMHEHRMWANRQLLSAISDLTEEQLHQEFEIGQGTLWKTLVHMQAAEYVWLEALQGNPRPVFPGDLEGKLPGNQLGNGALRDRGELSDHWQKLDSNWRTYLSQLDSSALSEKVYKVSTSSGAGKTHGTRRADVLMHVCTHAQYTAAQAINMLRHAGAAALPDIMLITLAREDSK